MITRTCDACDKVIQRETFVELSLRVLKTSGSTSQDEIEQVYGDYCDACLGSGAAMLDAFSVFEKHKPDYSLAGSLAPTPAGDKPHEPQVKKEHP